jgi:hypothetical protein
MQHSTRRALLTALVLFLPASLSDIAIAADAPISVHPDNPHYFLFRGKPTVLVTSAEHYGALLNAEFDYRRYFGELKAHDLNFTRTFSGVYREVPGSFNIKDNTLAPTDAGYIGPWARTVDGKYDLTKWNGAYFTRLKDLVKTAGERGVVVELVLFCTFYEDVLWDICPLNRRNNVNGVGNVGREEVHTLKERPLVDAQLALVRKLVAELKDFDNLYYEVCNEPYFAGVADDWQRLVSQTVADAEKGFPRKHLVARNIANGSKKIDAPDPNVSVFNFHYANPPDAVGQNYSLNKVIAYDETGFRGSGDAVYRTHAWHFLLAGGAVYNNLDYSFTANAEDGSAKVMPPTPGGGGVALRRQLRILRGFVDGFDFLRMQPEGSAVTTKVQGVTLHVLGEPGKQYAVYLSRVEEEKGADGKGTGNFRDPAGGKPVSLELHLPGGGYAGEWFNPRTGERTARKVDGGGVVTIETPPFEEDLALRLVSTGS